MINREKLELRKNGIGGSDAAKVAGLSKWGTPYDVYAEKFGLTESPSSSIAMDIGNLMENTILEKYEEMTGNTIHKDLPTKYHRKHNFILGNIDGLVKDKNIIVEAKTARSNLEWGKEGTDQIPMDYLCQVAHYCAIYDAPMAHIIVFFKMTEKFSLYTYERHSDFENALISKEKNFWENYIEKKVSPPFSNLYSVKSAFKESKSGFSVASEDLKCKFLKLLEIKNEQKKLQSHLESIQLDLMLEMGTNETLLDSEGVKLATWKNVNSTSFNLSEFKKHNVDLYSKFLSKKTTRRFLPSYNYNNQ